jgi:hypothetical protein
MDRSEDIRSLPFPTLAFALGMNLQRFKTRHGGGITVRVRFTNPFQLTGNNRAVVEVSKGYRADEPAAFPPDLPQFGGAAQSESSGGMAARLWCGIARNAWQLPLGLVSMLKAAR